MAMRLALALTLLLLGDNGDAAKLSSFRKKTLPPAGVHVVEGAAAAAAAGGAVAPAAAEVPPASAVPAPPTDSDAGGEGIARTFAPAEEFAAKRAAAQRRAKAGGKQAAEDKAAAQDELESLVATAELLQKHGDLAAAAEAYDRVLQLEPTSPRALANKAKVHYDLEELDHSERLYRKALVAHPVDPMAWLNLALVQLRRGLHLNDARMHARRSVTLLHASRGDKQLLERAHSILSAIGDAEAEIADGDEAGGDKDEL